MSRTAKRFAYLCIFAALSIFVFYVATDYSKPEWSWPVLSMSLIRQVRVNFTGPEYYYNPVQANCSELVAGDEREIKRVTNLLAHWWISPEERVYEVLFDCNNVRKLIAPDRFFVSQEELEFPLAFAILFHNSPQQILRLLSVIYRPHNFYCLHPDGKADRKLIQAFNRLSTCLSNVVVPQRLVAVTYRHFSTVDAHLNCFRELSKWKWKYLLLLCGKELPVSTNAEMVDGLMKANGSSLLDVHKISAHHYNMRFQSKYKVSKRKNKLIDFGQRQSTLPANVQIYKSFSYMGASRAFVEFLLTDKLVQELRKYMYTVLMPDEEFYATSYMLPNAPKGSHGAQVNMVKAFFAPGNSPCSGLKVHFVCILNLKDLPLLFKIANSTPRFFFFNKYYLEYDHVVMDCMEQRIVKLNEQERNTYNSLHNIARSHK